MASFFGLDVMVLHLVFIINDREEESEANGKVMVKGYSNKKHDHQGEEDYSLLVHKPSSLAHAENGTQVLGMKTIPPFMSSKRGPFLLFFVVVSPLTLAPPKP